MKSIDYWNLHAKIYKQKLDELDNETYRRIASNPHCDEAYNLNRIVKNIVESELAKLIPTIDNP